jgi:hypothetical protein
MAQLAKAHVVAILTPQIYGVRRSFRYAAFLATSSKIGTALATSRTPKITSGMLDAGSVPQ